MVKNSMVLTGAEPPLRFSTYKVAAEDGAPPEGDYKSMNNVYYYVSTLLLFGLQIFISIIVDDVT